MTIKKPHLIQSFILFNLRNPYSVLFHIHTFKTRRLFFLNELITKQSLLICFSVDFSPLFACLQFLFNHLQRNAGHALDLENKPRSDFFSLVIRHIRQECVHTCTQNSSKSRDCTLLNNKKSNHNNNLLKVPYIKWKMKAVRAFCVFFKAMKILFNLRFYTYKPVVVFFFVSHSLSVILLISSSFQHLLTVPQSHSRMNVETIMKQSPESFYQEKHLWDMSTQKNFFFSL